MSSRPEIAAQQQEYLSFLPLVRQQFGAIPGVDIIGLGAKERKGRATQEWAFRFYVQKKRPLKEIPAAERIPKSILGVKTDVIQHFEKVDLVTAPGLLIPEDPTDYRDTGIRGGIQIRNEYFSDKINSGYGTMGVLARTTGVPSKLVGLTCAHVVNSAADMATSVGHKIGHPKYHLSCCCCHHGWIGDVLLATANVDLDCALIEIHSDVATLVASNGTENKVAKDAAGGTDTITGAAAFLCFDIVSKYGRGTGYTTGNVIDIAYGTNQMLVAPIALGGVFAGQGDSGAVLLNSSKQVLGLVVAAAMDHTVAGPVAMTNAIVTLIKPIMQNLNITIAGTAHASIGDPVMGGGAGGCELFAWPGGQTDPNLNPPEPFLSSDFTFVGPVDWDVSTGPAGAVIVEADGAAVANITSVNGAAAVKIRYNTVSTSKNLTDAVRIKATSGALAPVNKFRTVFKFVPQAVKTAGALDVDDALRFAANGGTITNAGAAVPGTDGAIHYRAKAEIIYDILPADITWSGSAAIAFVNGAPAGLKGNIISRRQTKFTKGEQTAAAANRTHTSSDWTDSLEACAADNFQGASDAHKGKVFRLSNEGVDPSTFRQFYVRALYRDYLEVHNGTSWIRVTPYAEWWANLTGGLNAVAPPNVVAPNTIGAGTDATLIPNQQPVVTPGAEQEVAFGQVGVSISATAVDADNDVLAPMAWTQTTGTAVVLTGNPGNPVTFNAPATENKLKFSPVTKDSTETLPRTAGNHQSAPVEVSVNVVELLVHTIDALNCVNATEVFVGANFFIGAGPYSWNVTGGGTSATIIEADGVAIAATGIVASANTIGVSFGNISASASRADAVIIRATSIADPTKTFLKRRTVVATSPVIGITVARNPVGVVPSHVLAFNEAGWTEPESINVTICAIRVGANWKAVLLTANGNYTILSRLMPTWTEVTGPAGNTIAGNFCPQINDLDNTTFMAASWYMLSAVTAHEDVHGDKCITAMNDPSVVPVLKTAIEALTVPHVAGMTAVTAAAAIQALPAFAAALVTARSNWKAAWLILIAVDHGPGGVITTSGPNIGPAYIAEKAVTSPMIASICAAKGVNGWAACPPLCP